MKDKKILLLGADGQLGEEFTKYFLENSYSFVAHGRTNADITDEGLLRELFDAIRPHIVINCAAYNQVDAAEDNFEQVFEVNSNGPKNLAQLCKEYGAFLVHYSSDYVFDGLKNQAYVENDGTNPLNVYGESKLAGEKNIQEILNNYLIFRVSWLIGKGQQNFLFKLDDWAKTKSRLKIVDDEISVPTFTPMVVRLTLLALEKKLTGLFHMCSSGSCSRYELAKEYFRLVDKDIMLQASKMNDFNAKAIRPSFSVMSNELLQSDLGVRIESWKILLKDYLDR